MEDQMQPPPPPAHENDIGVAEECSPKHPQDFKVDPYETAVKDPGRITTQMRTKLREEASQIVSQKFPEAKEFLKERLAISIERRRTRILYRRQEDEASAWGKKTRTLTEFEAKHFRKPLELERGSIKSTESMRWKNKEDFPKPPKTESSQSHFVCQICFFSIPSEEAKGDLWIQHVIQDLTPYMCLLESCQSPQSAFCTFEEWVEHIKEDQRGSTSDVFVSCPLCSSRLDRDNVKSPSAMTDQELLQQHVASHLQSLALVSLALPYPNNEPKPEGSDSSREAVQSRLNPPKPMIPSRNQVYPSLSFNEREISRGFGQIITFAPRKFDNGFVPRPSPEGSSTNIALGQAWRPQEQTANTETFDVLVADDNIINQKVLSKMLGRHHHMVVTANNGQEALDAVKQRKYDVVLMDVSMPVMGGFEATEKIREYERRFGITRTPIIGLVVSMVHSDIERVFQAQSDDYLRKPIAMRELIEKVLHYGRLGRSAAGNDVHRFLASISDKAEAPRRTAAKL